jgi:sugar lactone lactonase YvrE
MTSALTLTLLLAGSPSTELFSLKERDLVPESVAHDPVDDVHYVGALHKRKIVRVDRSGTARDFVKSKQDGLWSVLGLKVDPVRRELWANSCNAWVPPPMIDPEPGTVGTAAVFRYDLRTGRLVKKYEAGGPLARVCFNDLALTDKGDVFITAGTDGVYRIRRETDRLEVFATPPDFANGIAVSRDGTRLYVALHGAGVVRMDETTGRVRRVAMPEGSDLRGVDGLYLDGDSLVAIQNGREPARVVQAFLDPEGVRVTCVSVLEDNHPLFSAVPTAGVVVGKALHYVANSQLDAFVEGNPQPTRALRESVILKTPLRSSCLPVSASATSHVPRPAFE